MKKKLQRLTLSRETLRHLNMPVLTHARGAVAAKGEYTEASVCMECLPPPTEASCNSCVTNCTLWC